MPEVPTITPVTSGAASSPSEEGPADKGAARDHQKGGAQRVRDHMRRTHPIRGYADPLGSV